MAELQIDVRSENGVATIVLRGELDAYSAPRLRQILDPQINAAEPAVLIDMAALEYIDSAGLGVLVAALKQITDRDGRFGMIFALAARGPSPSSDRPVQNLFDLLGFGGGARAFRSRRLARIIFTLPNEAYLTLPNAMTRGKAKAAFPRVAA